MQGVSSLQTESGKSLLFFILTSSCLISVIINMIFSKYFLEATYRILRNITIQSIFHCLDMFFLLPQGKYSRILETMEIEEDNCSPYLVPRISSYKQTERNRETVTSLHSESSNHKQYVGPGLFLPTQRRYITLHSSRSEIGTVTFDQNPFDQKDIWPKFFWPNGTFDQKIIWPKNTLTEKLFDQKSFDQKFFDQNAHLTKNFLTKMHIWPKNFWPKCTFDQKIFYQNAHLTKYFFTKWGHLTKFFLTKWDIWPNFFLPNGTFDQIFFWPNGTYLWWGRLGFLRKTRAQFCIAPKSILLGLSALHSNLTELKSGPCLPKET